jgi:hypothetical protein
MKIGHFISRTALMRRFASTTPEQAFTQLAGDAEMGHAREDLASAP